MAGAVVDYDSEHRLAVVMYGGVSLAIYIGGIARELLGIVRATAPGRTNAAEAGIGDGDLTNVERIYRRVARMGNGMSWEQSADGAASIRKRVSIDIVSGTSAGGINGIFLSKALANDTDLDPILKLWVDEGDLARLLNDRESLDGVDGLKAQDPPVALLNGERMYRKLLDAFATMDRNAARDKRYDPGRVDLFVTTTDIRGELINLPVLNATAQEKRHRQRFHFTYEQGRETEFAQAENATLAFAARCTSSFPFAFEPFTWKDAARLAGESADKAEWRRRLLYTSPNYEERPMGDGGYLDNKPFSWAIDELARRQSAFKVSRTLLYVEPDPKQYDAKAVMTEQEVKPDAIENALAALITIPGYETVREDLQRVLERNERAETFRRAEREVERAFAPNVERWRGAGTNLQGREWLDHRLDSLLDRYGPAYGAYHRFKIDALIDTIADHICAAGSIERPEIAQVIREIVRRWGRTTYKDFEDEKKLLVNVDIDYRLRRLSFVLRRATEMKSEAVAECRARLKSAYDEYYVVRSDLRNRLQEWVRHLSTMPSNDTLTAIARLRNPAREQAIEALMTQMSGDGLSLQRILEATEGRLTAISAKARGSLAGSSDPEVRTLLEYYDLFQSYDVFLYPMMRNSGIDEGAQVDIVRVSPRDVRRPHTLRGMSLGHFGAFLEDDWRRNDILWGRLDAAETIIRLMLPDHPAADAIIAEAHREIIAEQLGGDLRKRYTEAAAPKLDAAPRDAAARRKEQLTLKAAAEGCLDDAALLHRLFVEEGGGYDASVNRQKQLVSAGRAGVIAEKILHGTAVKSKFPWPAMPKLLVSGFAALAQIAVPRSFVRVATAYWARLLTLVFIALVAVGMLTGATIVTWTGVKGLAVITTAALIVFFLQRWTEGRLLRVILTSLFWIGAAAAGLWVLQRQFHIPTPELLLELKTRASQIPWITGVDAVFIATAFALAIFGAVAWVVVQARRTARKIASARPRKPAMP